MESRESGRADLDAGGVEMTIRVNGVETRLPDASSLLELIDSMGLDRRFLVVEYNGEPLGRGAFEGIVLREGDRLEMVRPVAGG